MVDDTLSRDRLGTSADSAVSMESTEAPRELEAPPSTLQNYEDEAYIANAVSAYREALEHYEEYVDGTRGRQLHDALNELAEVHCNSVQAVSYAYNHVLRRVYKRLLEPSEYVLVDTVYDRTLGWAGAGTPKVSEIITLPQLERGMPREWGAQTHIHADGGAVSTDAISSPNTL